MKSNRTRRGLCGSLGILDDRRIALLGGFESLFSDDIDDPAPSADPALNAGAVETERSGSDRTGRSSTAPNPAVVFVLVPRMVNVSTLCLRSLCCG